MSKMTVKVRPTMEKSFDKAIKKINKALEKSNLLVVPFLKGECDIHITCNNNHFLVKGKEYEVEVPDVLMKVGEYNLIGQFEKMEGKWYRTLFSTEIKDEMEVNINNLRCDHCHKNITNRNKYYFFRNKEEKLYVVGSTCVNDFIGFNAEDVLSKMGDIVNIERNGNHFPTIAEAEYVSLEINDFVEIVKELTAGFTKWVKKETSISLKDRIKNIFFGKQEMPNHIDNSAIIEEVRKYWSNNMEFDDFSVNTRESVKDNFVPVKWAGIAGFGIYKVEGLKNGSFVERKEGNYVGNIGESITKDLNVKKYFSFPSKFRHNETVYGIELIDNEQNHYLTFTNSNSIVNQIRNGMNTLKANFVITGQEINNGIKVNKIKQLKLV